jgi:predicted Fe-Mo cluster-binding NifX family protein
VRIAIPISHNRISPLFDTAARMLVLTCRDGREAAREEMVLAPQPPEALAGTVAGLDLDLLLCGAVSGALLRALQSRGVCVRPHLCGELEAILQAYCHGELDRPEFRIPGCRAHHPPVPKPAGFESA